MPWRETAPHSSQSVVRLFLSFLCTESVSLPSTNAAPVKALRGMRDFPPQMWARHRAVADVIAKTIRQHGYHEVQTPIAEYDALFTRALGETTDIVSKEMFRLMGREADSSADLSADATQQPGRTTERTTDTPADLSAGLSADAKMAPPPPTGVLRPENTAAVARMAIEHRLLTTLPMRFSYEGPMFRYERPQKGRYRQFHQCGVEFYEATPSATSTVEVIACAHHILTTLGLRPHTKLEINTLGQPDERAKWRDHLIAHFSRYEQRLSPDSQHRLRVNPMRILDSKHPDDQEIAENAPALGELLGKDSRAHWEAIQAGLDAVGIEYVISPRLVRGLDYYSGAVFEFTTTALGAQDAIIAGGRYDGLIPLLGGEALAAIGWAGGIDRMTDMIETLETLATRETANGLQTDAATDPAVAATAPPASPASPLTPPASPPLASPTSAAPTAPSMVLVAIERGTLDEGDPHYGEILALAHTIRRAHRHATVPPLYPWGAPLPGARVAVQLMERDYPNRRKFLTKTAKSHDGKALGLVVHIRARLLGAGVSAAATVGPAKGNIDPQVADQAPIVVRDMHHHRDVMTFSSVADAHAFFSSDPVQHCGDLCRVMLNIAAVTP